MSNSKANKYANILNSDAFLRASTINTRLSLLARELNDNIDNLVINEQTFDEVLKKAKINPDMKTIHASNKYKINFDSLISDDFSCDNIIIEEKQKDILYKGKDEEELKIIEEENEIKEEFKEKKKENINIYEDVENAIENKDNKKENAIGSLFDEYLEDGNNEENKNNNIENPAENNLQFMRASTMFQDILDFNQEYQEINNNIIKDLNAKTKEQKKNNDNKNLHASTIFNNILHKEEEENKLEEKKIQPSKEENLNKKEEIIKEEEEEEKIKDVLKEEYYPIDVIEEAEKYYNLSNDSKEDLYPLNTYQTKNGLNIEYINYMEKKFNDNQAPLSAIGVDELGNTYICTQNGKIIKKNKNKEIIIYSEKYQENICCIDIFDNIIVTGDDTGNIIIWKNDKINQALINIGNKNEILCIKIITYIENSKLILIFSDSKGDLSLVDVNPNKIAEYTQNSILNQEEMPIYNINLYLRQKSDISKDKENIILVIASSQSAGIYNCNLETLKLNALKEFEYTYGEKGKFTFDISIGQGFPPVADLKKENQEIAALARGSISNSISVKEKEEENLMIAVSYGSVVQLFGIRFNEKNVLIFKVIGYFINDKPILRMFFIFNSMLALLTENNNIKLINTYDFIPKTFNQSDTDENKPTKSNIISYEPLDINKLSIRGHEIEIGIENHNLKKKFYTNKIIPIEKGILIVGKEPTKFYQCFTYNYSEIINNLCQNEDYIKMLWLSLLVFNRKQNVLNKQLSAEEKNYINKDKEKICDSFLMIFFIQKIIPELTNKNEIYVRMFLEFFMETNLFQILPKYISLLLSSFSNTKDENLKLDKYIYINLTKYMVNGNLNDIILNQDLLKQYIKYYLNKNDKLLLNKVLLKLNVDTLLQKDILKIIMDNELINPYIYTRIKNIKEGRTDYFLPADYLDSIFKKDIFREKYELEQQDKNDEILKREMPELYEKQKQQRKEQMEKELEEKKAIEREYKKLIIEHNMEFFNEKTFSCHEYIGHKFLWYCNKCISGKEYPNDNQMSPNNLKQTAIKILSCLINRENIKLYLEFDSYTYLQIIKKFFTDQKLFELIDKNGYSSSIQKIKEAKDVKEVITKYLGPEKFDSFNCDYILKSIEDGVNDCILNTSYISYDFYIMICELCTYNKNLFFDKMTIKEVLIFFGEFNVDSFSKNDPFNCHRKPETRKAKKQYYQKIEEYMLNLLNYLKDRGNLDESFVKDLIQKLIEKNKIRDCRKVYFYLCEESKNFRECFKMKLDEYERDPDNFGEKEVKDFFGWIEHILEYSYSQDIINEKVLNKDRKEDEDTELIKCKKIILSYLKILSEISIDELSKITDIWFSEEDEQEDLIQHLGGGASNTLQLKYLDHLFLIRKEDMNDNIEKYMKFLLIELDILIKERNKKRIKDLLTEYKVLCNEDTLAKLLLNNINDCCIYIYQYLGRVKDGVELTLEEVNQKYKNIKLILKKPNYNPILIDIELKELYKYFEMGLSVCQSNFLEQEKEDKQIDDNWQSLFNKACEFKIDFFALYDANRNNIKTRDHKKIFDSLQNCIQLILDKMSDYITLDLLVEIISANVSQGKIIEFYTFLDKSFFSFRRTETILQSGKNLMSTSILIHYDDLGKLKTEGKHISISEQKCDFCKNYIKDFNSYQFKLFECGHKYHIHCSAEEKGVKVCYICTKEEIGDNAERAQNFKEGKLVILENEEDKKKQEEIQKKLEEKKRRFMAKGRLGLLKKIRKKKREINAVLSGNIIYGPN